MKQDVISLKKEQFNRYRLIQEVIDGQLTAKDAAEELNLSTRQIQRLKKEAQPVFATISAYAGILSVWLQIHHLVAQYILSNGRYDYTGIDSAIYFSII